MGDGPAEAERAQPRRALPRLGLPGHYSGRRLRGHAERRPSRRHDGRQVGVQPARRPVDADVLTAPSGSREPAQLRVDGDNLRRERPDREGREARGVEERVGGLESASDLGELSDLLPGLGLNRGDGELDFPRGHGREDDHPKGKDAQRVALLVGSNGAHDLTLKCIEKLRGLGKKVGKIVYTVVVGEPTPQKLGNFPEMDLFVLIGSPELSLLPAKGFYKPVIHPWEFMMACSGKEWNGKFLVNWALFLDQQISIDLKG